MDPEVESWLRATRDFPSKQRSLGFPRALKAIVLVLFFAALMFGLGYKVGFDTATIASPPCPSGKMIPAPPARGRVIL